MKDIKHIRRDFSLRRLGHAPGVGIEGVHGGWEGQNLSFSGIQPNLVCELLT